MFRKVKSNNKSDPITKVSKAAIALAVAQTSGKRQRIAAATTRLENVSREAEYLLNLDVALNRRAA